MREKQLARSQGRVRSRCNFDIKYRSGKKNANADSLSRLPGSSQPQDAYQTVDRETVEAICKSPVHVPFAETLCMSVNVLSPIDHKDIDVSQVRPLQREDPVIGKIIRMVNQGEQPELQTFLFFDLKHTRWHTNFRSPVLDVG